ncbi:hypothetical protein [Longirhabdus pacifica]|uniref:hypothetical protein n=1 Tax=Longirhabdus pacifica TaxID=2305227 RepID=UPI0010087C97|nr:hypothetical protein [Longirhabdus pacifica]
MSTEIQQLKDRIQKLEDDMEMLQQVTQTPKRNSFIVGFTSGFLWVAGVFAVFIIFGMLYNWLG